ncbi:MAG: DUF4202 domain-containing protein [Acidimicrobiia bacterium]|nr:DUF4202 domain-containing protein [Acidimicrobiia bacterium]MBP8182021.1 DUF4202 domain-containing protein [Acidimicrobiia bacterium]
MCDLSESDVRLSTTLDAIDRQNRRDPRSLTAPFDGPMAYVQGSQASKWLALLDDDPSPELQIAVRAHHLDRWLLPRADYPAGRAGYLRWRRDQKTLQSESAASLMSDQGWPQAAIEEVQRLLLRKDLRTDPQSQTLEDCACLVFLESQFNDFSTTTDRSKIVGVVAKTWNKMSNHARALASGIAVDQQAGLVLEEGIEAAGSNATAADLQDGPAR